MSIGISRCSAEQQIVCCYQWWGGGQRLGSDRAQEKEVGGQDLLLCDVTASNLVQVELYAILPLRYQKKKENADRLRKLTRKQMGPAFEVVLF